MKPIWKILLAVLGVVFLMFITQPLWRYQVWVRDSNFLRYDRLTGEVQLWEDHYWKKL
jgi:hypothetical protein